MGKDIWKPGTVIYPVPAVMVSCGTMEQKNIITVAWTGTVNSDPAMTYVSIRPSRHSYNIIKETGEFVINLPAISAACAAAEIWINLKPCTSPQRRAKRSMHPSFMKAL